MNRIDGVAMTMLLIASSISDLRDYRIPNHLIISGWLMGLVFHFWQRGMGGLGDGLICLVASIILIFPAYLMGAIGAGDVKLLSVVGCMYGLEFWWKVTAVFLVLAGTASLMHMLYTKSLFLRFRYLFQYLLTDRKGKYYQPERDGRGMVIPLVPLLAVAYYIVLMGVWK